MPTQKAGYYLKSGERVPSVTTILSRFKESNALIDWAARMAGKYVNDNAQEQCKLLRQDWIALSDVAKLCAQSASKYRDVRDSAADAGTLAHAAVEHWVKQEPIVFSGQEEVVRRAEKSFDAFLEWAKQTKLEIVETELPLVSETYRFGGTFDCILVQGKRAMGDWKTSNAVYGEMLCQLAAYRILWEENFPDKPIDGGFHLLRFDKTYGDFKHHWWGELETAKKSFLLMRELYENDKELRKRAQ